MSRSVGLGLGVLCLAQGILATTPSDARETCWTMGSGQFFDAMHYCVSSFLPKSSKSRYGPRNLSGIEGGKHLAWCEGVRGDGIGQTITIRVNNGSSFSRLQIGNGYGKTRKSYRENGRIKDVRITTNSGIDTTTRLPDQNGILPFFLPASAEYKWVRLEILSVYRGSRYRDTCLDFVMPDFEYDEQLLQSRQNPPDVPAPVREPVVPSPDMETPPIVREAAPQPDPATVPITPPIDGTPPKDTRPFDDDEDPFGDLGMPDPDELELPD